MRPPQLAGLVISAGNRFQCVQHIFEQATLCRPFKVSDVDAGADRVLSATGGQSRSLYPS
jgi:hypothetical protein